MTLAPRGGRGYSLVELVIVCACILILTAMIVLMDRMTKSRYP